MDSVCTLDLKFYNPKYLAFNLNWTFSRVKLAVYHINLTGNLIDSQVHRKTRKKYCPESDIRFQWYKRLKKCGAYLPLPLPPRRIRVKYFKP